jgi:hypothetical protein
MSFKRMIKGKLAGRLHATSEVAADLRDATFDPAASHPVMRAAIAI